MPIEAALTLIGLPYEVVGEARVRDVARNPAVLKVNPLGQVPALVLPGGEVMTEDESGVLDLYVATVSRWSPRRSRFYREAPKMASVVRRIDSHPGLARFWEERFPFSEGWES